MCIIGNEKTAEFLGYLYGIKEGVSIVKDGDEHPMVGAIPVSVEHTPRPQGHGYVQARVDRAMPFFTDGTALRGHEFHYSRIREETGWGVAGRWLPWAC